MKYLTLFVLRLTHAYYADGRCPDFEIEPAPATQRLLKNHQCVLKSMPGEVRVLVAASADQGQFIPLPLGATFTFRLRLWHPNFALFTDLTEINQLLAPLYSKVGTNGDDSTQLALTSRQAWSTERFLVHQPASGERFTLSGRPLANVPLAEFDLTGAESLALTDYDAEAKIITVNSTTASPGTPFQIIYPIIPPETRSVLAEVEIQYEDTWPGLAQGPPEFEIAFAAKAAKWAYYLVTDRIEADFQLVDTSTDLPFLFNQENLTDLNQQPDPADEIAQILAAQYPTMQLVRFVSDEPIPCQQMARKSLQLRLDDQPVLETLPNPWLKNYTVLEIRNNGSVTQEDALFQVINYFNHQFSITRG